MSNTRESDMLPPECSFFCETLENLCLFLFTKTHISPKFLGRKFKLASNEAAYLIRSPNTKKSVKLRISSGGRAVIQFLIFVQLQWSFYFAFTLFSVRSLFKVIKFGSTL